MSSMPLAALRTRAGCDSQIGGVWHLMEVTQAELTDLFPVTMYEL